MSESSRTPSAEGIFSKLDTFFGKRSRLFISVIIILATILGVNLFDLKISVGGDDSAYLENAYKFIKGITFPSHLGAGYPLFLSPFVALMGINIGLFKIFSFIFVLLQFWFLYKAFKGNISSAVLMIALLISAVNSNILYFGSQTYSEAFYMFLQASSIYVFFQILKELNEGKEVQSLWKQWLLFGFLAFFLGTTRMVGYALFMSAVIYFLVFKQSKSALFSLGSFMLFFVPFTLYKKFVWEVSSAGRFGNIFLKNTYKATEGKEDFTGMMVRFGENIETYLSKFFLSIIGLRPEVVKEATILPGIILMILIVGVLILTFKRNKHLFFVVTYLIIATGITLVAIQQNWKQIRLIVIYVPLILMSLLWGLVEISKNGKLKVLQLLLIVLCSFIFFKTLGRTIEKGKANSKTFAKNIAGDRYYGFTPDWVHFLKMSEWVSKNIDEQVVVGSRKPTMSFIYGNGRSFYPMYKFPMVSEQVVKDSLIKINAVAISFKQLQESKPSSQAVQIIRNEVIYIMNKGGEIIAFLKSENPVLKTLFQAFKLDTHDPIEFIETARKTEKNIQYVSPDELIGRLYDRDVEYLINASLRMNPKQKTNRTINTINRYIFFVQLKYPRFVKEVHKIGHDQNEPAKLYQITYPESLATNE